MKARLISYAEVCFILAEAAQKGWSVGGTQQDWYENGVKASFDTWGVGDDASDYLAGAGVAYDGQKGMPCLCVTCMVMTKKTEITLIT
jgi:hypothetical protein